MRTLLITLAILVALTVAFILIPSPWHRAGGEAKMNCGRLYFHLLGVDTSGTGNDNALDIRIAVYSMRAETRDTMYEEVSPYALGGGWYIVDNCSPVKKIEIAREGSGTDLTAINLPWRAGTTVVIDSIPPIRGSFVLDYDRNARRFTGQIPGQRCDDCIDITPRNWDQARELPTVALR